MRFGLAWRAFWKILFDADLATRFERLLASSAEPEPVAAIPEAAPKRPPSQPPKPAKSTRSDALVLLETLQREARFIDLIKESLENYGDAEVGAAARDVLRQSGEVVERFFGLEPIVSEPEGSAHEVAAGFDSGRIRLTGNVAGDPPYRGVIAHHGWIATRSELPTYSGSQSAAPVVAPLEVEIK